MAAVAAGLRRGEVAVEVREARAGNVASSVLLLAESGLEQVVPAIEDAPAGATRQFLGA